jgi:hypothetical protein
MRFLARMGFFLLIVSPLAFLLVTDPIRRTPEPRPTPPPRPAAFRVCPGLAIGAVPEGMVLERRELRNLGENVMGRSIQYSRPGQRVWVAVGFEVFEELDDLDFTDGTVEMVGGRRVRLTTTNIISTSRIRAAAWDDERFEPPCDEFTVVAWNLAKKKFIDVVDSVKVVYGESRQGGIG